ncbi:uncharacterized protein MONOS_1384 [Monocercomonoides exilis]|uniref:uncharacterized protein n=1 Tax=Monocercomonoides exilis TaxID=2049356 RepID=UPI00355AC112|nr:hypothetical protein MONOS_1384 [Monocercomonoides exilis]|eukprot:MONOS_1384.1-p1 / transcript=MONOS_1384.1 / gene=MONOS_1384 / organism=Monocercomonoides_exilis_PA203 / gene_product=unspecified product / transcript_product=unspecified product / location=Mono_scaffold00024:47132-54310(-) / protein_length=2315 / sequence_SO=supercontig / SO=protein_coding / is_pseudo=false
MEHSCCLSSMENCLIFSCVNVFEGGISSGSFSSEEFVCRNTSINFGKREMNALEKKGQMNITDSQSFSLCEWTDCTAPQGGALYVHDNSNAILKVENSSFMRCNASLTRGGGIYALIIAECIVRHSSFVQCSAAATTNYGGGGILSSDGAGGAIIHWDPTDKVVISNCLFCNCYSMYAGGAVGGHDVALHGSTENNIDSTCCSTRQTENRVSTSCYFVVDRSEWLRNDSRRIRYVSSVQTEPNSIDTYACGRDEGHPCCTINRCLTQLIPEFVTDIEILAGTIAETKSVNCDINVYAIYGQCDSTTTVQTELEAAGLSLFAVSTGTLTVRDFALVHNFIHPNNRGSRLFDISGAGGMSISRLNISAGSGQSTETAFTTELINVQNGVLQMDNVNWAKTILTTSLFSLSSTNEISLTLSECAFDGAERTNSGAAVISFSNDKTNIKLNSCSFSGCGSTGSENGGSMMLCAGNENEVKVKGGSLDGCFCSASNGLGGGILLRLLNENPNFLISSEFGTNTAKWGSDIFVISPNLEETAKSQKIKCVTGSLDFFDKVRGYDNGNTSVAIPLCIYLLPIPTEICVSNSEASDHSHCGIVQFPCLTLKHSLTRQTGEKKVIANGMIMMADELAFADQKHEIRGNDDESGWTVSDSSATSNSAMITASIETVLSKLIFSLPSSLPLHSTFISSSSQLTLSQCSLTLQNSSSELVSLFLSVESGILILDKFSASSIDLRRSPLISLSGSGTKAELISNQWLNMTNCTFTEIERTAGSGGCVSIDNSNDENSNAEINIEECDFDGCSVLADGSRGGAIDAQLKGSIQMNVISCTFTGCTAPAEERKIGFGGGMELKLIDDDSSFVISSPVFDAGKPNIAKHGNDLFVESPSLTKSITNASLPFVSENLNDISLDSMRGFDGSDTTNAIPLIYFWIALGSEIFVGGEGKDMGACGFSDCPCLSIDYSLDRLPEGNEKNISIVEKVILQKSVDVSGVCIKSNDEEICSLESASSLEGAEEEAMKIQGITNFELINFVVPSSFASGAKTLLHVCSSNGLLTVTDCSFTKMEESREEIISYGLIKADGGTVQLELVTIQSLSFSKDVISVLSSTMLNIKNLTMKNVDLDGSSGLSISKSAAERIRRINEADKNIVIEWSVFEEVTQNTTADIPIIRNDDDDEPLKTVIKNTTMKKCGGTRCGKGGAIFSLLNEGGNFECSFCTISECFCSSTGRGGWLFLECSSIAEQPLNFVLSNITFKDNSAFRGRDVYVKCHSLENQIADEQFLLDFRAPFVKERAIWGCTTDSFVGEEDLLLRVVKYQSETIFVSSAADNHEDSKQCGEFGKPCESLNVGIQHIIPSRYSQLLISEETIVNGESSALNVIIRSLESPSIALVHMNSTIAENEGNILTSSENVRIERLKFNFGQPFSYSGSSIIREANGQLSLLFVDFSSVGQSDDTRPVFLNSTLLNIGNGILHIDNCSISMLSFKKSSFLLSGDEINITNIKLEQIESTRNVVEIGQCGSVVFNGIDADGVKLSESGILEINDLSSGIVSIGISSFNNCSRNSEGASVLSGSSTSAQITLSNCSCSNCYSMSDKGSIMEMNNGRNILMDLCRFIGVLAKERESENMNIITDICQWNGSLVHSTNSSLVMTYATMLNASSGGLSTSAGNLTIEKGEFENNNPFIEKYPSVRRNILCTDSASLTISSLKGGDGLKDNSSLWILNDRCTLDGIAGERASPFFIPRLEDVSVNENGSNIGIKFKGSLLLPCDLLFRLTFKTEEVELVETFQFEEDSFVSETEVTGTIPSENISLASADTEISVVILYGKLLAETSPQILKNKTESKNENEKVVEGGKEGKSYWLLIVCIVIVVILLAVIIVLAVRWRKEKNENNDLREIVNDNIRKDPKAFEMATMEMSPEEQWRRAEREAEKKNEERIKKRAYDTNMQHSESSEHLLAESGSTEYILGRDSNKIPEWALEKVEEEETRKRTPSPSISSTSTTSTTDSDSTFVRGEDLCPTTSSMSNLVDAMACSSPFEKLIVDLRDSLFMLLHGRNEKKEMEIGSLQQREQTAAQILFWVANGALHSFDEMENPLQSLANLSPHIVLFSEHMVICIVMHSDLLSDDSDSSSVSSSTVVTSASDDDEDSDSLPSSAFEDEDFFKKECFRWKAPELLINKKMGAAKESVSFSIGMMLWECLTMQIPFGEYEAEVAGDKIVNGERPNMKKVEGSRLKGVVEKSVLAQAPDRVSLSSMKREFIRLFPTNAVMLTATDALCYSGDSNEERCESISRRNSRIVECVLIDENKDDIKVGDGNGPDNKFNRN